MASGGGVIILGPGEGHDMSVLRFPLTYKATNSQTGREFSFMELAG